MNPLSNPKAALGVAAAIAVMAIAASAGLSGFVTDTGSEVESPEDAAMLAAEMEPKEAPKPKAQTSWADGDGTDDWGASGNEGSMSEAGWGTQDNNGPRGETPDFGDYNPEPGAGDSGDSGGGSPGPSANPGGGSQRGPGKVTSGAASSAPDVSPPGL